MLQGRPDIVYHCAAWTAVDAAEDFRETVFRVNAQGTLNIAKACKETGCKMVYISTDYEFDGQGTEPWQPDCKDYAPLNVYGRSKLAGEEAVAGMLEKYFIIRIAWVFGVNGSNFVRTMLNIGRKYDTLRVVNDQIGTPTYTRDLAELNRWGYFDSDEGCATKTPGVFVAGDCRSKSVRQLTTAAGDGAVAALAACRYIDAM